MKLKQQKSPVCVNVLFVAKSESEIRKTVSQNSIRMINANFH